ncbi:AAA family ATPase [Derxia lacustris]|uniref:AAA family ATPase n=1 Tax=Derxia lacustris TaxID=764842 RepID=UPI000A177E34|nr:AAA family ATPase [Derxia lacustris]
MSAVRPDIATLLAPAAASASVSAEGGGLDGALGRLLGFHHRALGGRDGDAAAVEAATRALVAAHALGHACLPLEAVAAQAGLPTARLRAALEGSPVVLRVGAAGVAAPEAGDAATAALPPPDRPLVLDAADRLYLARHFDSERRLALALHALATGAPGVAAPAGLVERLFANLRPNPAQRAAVERVLAERFVVITGGPGTGKTTTVARCIAAVLQAEPEARVLLAAPTGKAAARMNEALASQLDLLPADLVVRRRHLPPARTVHALLGLVPGKADAIRHHAGRPLDADLVVVDEASMLGLTLARRLADAVRPGARLVLLGDPDQLASVETGLVLAELAAGDDPPLPQAIARLRAGERFAADSPVGRLAAEVGRADVAAVFAALDAGGVADAAGAAASGVASHAATAASDAARRAAPSRRRPAPAAPSAQGDLFGAAPASQPTNGAPSSAASASDAPADAPAAAAPAASVSLDSRPLGAQALARELLPLFDPVLACLAEPAVDPDAALAAFERARVLCAVHDGPRGTRALNAALARLAAARLAAAGRPDATGNGDWPHGRPLLITRNDPGTGLANGDVGLVLHDADGARAWFRLGDGLRAFPVARLPACETAWALSIHKSQGSEFDRVEIVLPDAADGSTTQRLLTRELLYTAITRSRRELRLWAARPVLESCVRRATRRHSGLADRLRALARG